MIDLTSYNNLDTQEGYLALLGTLQRMEAAIGYARRRADALEEDAKTPALASLALYPTFIPPDATFYRGGLLSYPTFVSDPWPNTSDTTYSTAQRSVTGQSFVDQTFILDFYVTDKTTQIRRSIPTNFSEWLPDAITLRYGMDLDGGTPEVYLRLSVYDPADGTTKIVTKSSSGSAVTYPGYLYITRDDLSGRLFPGAPLVLEFEIDVVTPGGLTNLAEFGRLELNWK